MINKVQYIQDLSEKAYLCKRTLDKNPNEFFGVTENNAAKYYQDFLKEKVKNPTMATLVFKREVELHPIENYEEFALNHAKLEKKPEIQALLKQIVAKEAMYPKTSHIRQELITQDRISMYYVKPRLTGLKKLALKLKMFV